MSNVKELFHRFGAYISDVGVEYKKISWPSLNELTDSTKVVILFIVILAVTVAIFDKVILFFLQLLHA